jgi:hypothetical protein
LSNIRKLVGVVIADMYSCWWVAGGTDGNSCFKDENYHVQWDKGAMKVL